MAAVRRWVRWAVVSSALLACCGCPLPSQNNNNNNTSLPFLDPGASSSFSAPQALTLSDTGTLEFEGRVDKAGNVDVYLLGALAAGDQVHVDVQGKVDGMDLVAAIFDKNQDLVGYNDDRAADSSDLNPLVDFVMREDSDPAYLALAPFVGSTVTGRYTVTVQITMTAGVPSPNAQIVFLNWAGGQHVVIPNVGTFDLPAFDAADLGPFGNQTAAMKQRVQQIVADRYTGYDLILRNSDDDPIPTEPHSTVHFGGFNAQAFAISEEVDNYNADPSDDTIIFTQSYQDAFAHTPTFEEASQALGNTVAHEVGHLLGLVHTADCDDLMDSGCVNDRLLTAQRFKTAILSQSTFPIGFQDSAQLLDWILGLATTPP